jgi:hypothetical protein
MVTIPGLLAYAMDHGCPVGPDDTLMDSLEPLNAFYGTNFPADAWVHGCLLEWHLLFLRRLQAEMCAALMDSVASQPLALEDHHDNP